MRLTATSISCFIFFILMSCDVITKIVVKNKSDKPVYFSWEIRPGSDLLFGSSQLDAYRCPDSIVYNAERGTRTVIYKVGTKKGQDEKEVYMGGIGYWSISRLYNSITYNKICGMEIIGENTQVRIADSVDIVRFLYARNRKHIITLKIK